MSARKQQSKSEFETFQSEFLITGAESGLEQGPFVDGLTLRTVIGALFVAVVMMPGSVYLGLVAGQTLGPAAEWVTIILFAEIARRSFTHLRRQEVFVLFYVASTVAAVTLLHLALTGGPLAMCIWNQYIAQSPQTTDIASQIPDWVVPPIDSPAMQERNLLHKDWWWSSTKGMLSPILMIGIGYVLSRFGWFTLGYIMFRLTSDRERLPFPLAPVTAEGSTALAESTDRDDEAKGYKATPSWRWRIFSVGVTLGILFGAVYVLVPVVTGLFMTRPVMILPIPFVDFTKTVEGVLPASLVSISFDAGLFITGMILPFRMVVGTFVACILTSILGNPVLQHFGVFSNWTPGNNLLVNQLVLQFDFWLSVTIGMALAVAAVGIWVMIKAFTSRSGPDSRPDPRPAEIRNAPNEPPYRQPSKERGDIPLWLSGLIFVFVALGFTLISHILVPDFPIGWFIFFGFVWSPINSYISARLIGLTGQPLVMPFLKETVFITSGYPKVDIWFAPIPLFDFGPAAQRFRELELTRTKFTSIFKAEIMMLPIIFVSSFLFWWFFWKMNQIPSDAFPFAARVWPVAARQAYLIYTANSSDNSLLLQAIDPTIIGGSMGLGLVIYLVLSALKIPVIFFYGLIGGIGQPLHMSLSLLVGALFSRYYFIPRFTKEVWARYVPVIAAGFACGMGLAGMTAVALALVQQCTRNLPF